MAIPPNTDKVLILSIGFFLLFIAFGSAASFAPQSMKNDGYDRLGFQSLAFLNLSLSVSSFFSSSIVNLIGVKKSLVFGSFCYVLWIFSFILPTIAKD